MIRRRTVGINSLRTRPLRRRRRVGRPKVRRRRPPSPTPSHAVRSEGDKACRPSPIKGLLFTRASFTNSTSLTSSAISSSARTCTKFYEVNSETRSSRRAPVERSEHSSETRFSNAPATNRIHSPAHQWDTEQHRTDSVLAVE